MAAHCECADSSQCTWWRLLWALCTGVRGSSLRHCGQGDEGRGRVGSKRAPAESEQATFPLDVTTVGHTWGGQVSLCRSQRSSHCPACLERPLPGQRLLLGLVPSACWCWLGGRAWGFRMAPPRMLGLLRSVPPATPAVVLAVWPAEAAVQPVSQLPSWPAPPGFSTLAGIVRLIFTWEEVPPGEG